MIHVRLKEPGDDWKEWKQKADNETRQLVENAKRGVPLKLKKSIWKKLKPFLESIFHKKCAYCEGIYVGGSWPDVEHYRPKGKVTIDRNKKNALKITGADGIEMDHPGYYWLAYDWRNLLLSCKKCNSGKGKMNQFPIGGKRSCCIDDSLDDEKPFLINPCEEEKPEDHLFFGIKGTILGKSERGKKTIEICDLNREELRTCREKEWGKLKIKLFQQLLSGGTEKIITDDMEYSAYLRQTLKQYHKYLSQQIEKRT